MGEAKNIKPNLDYRQDRHYSLIGYDTEDVHPAVRGSRITGWTAHIMEQLTSNALIRPLSLYNGPGMSVTSARREKPAG
jgi:citrate synthase/2-methylcitrate synthase